MVTGCGQEVTCGEVLREIELAFPHVTGGLRMSTGNLGSALWFAGCQAGRSRVNCLILNREVLREGANALEWRPTHYVPAGQVNLNSALRCSSLRNSVKVFAP